MLERSPVQFYNTVNREDNLNCPIGVNERPESDTEDFDEIFVED